MLREGGKKLGKKRAQTRETRLSGEWQARSIFQRAGLAKGWRRMWEKLDDLRTTEDVSIGEFSAPRPVWFAVLLLRILAGILAPSERGATE